MPVVIILAGGLAISVVIGVVSWVLLKIVLPVLGVLLVGWLVWYVHKELPEDQRFKLPSSVTPQMAAVIMGSVTVLLTLIIDGYFRSFDWSQNSRFVPADVQNWWLTWFTFASVVGGISILGSAGYLISQVPHFPAPDEKRNAYLAAYTALGSGAVLLFANWPATTLFLAIFGGAPMAIYVAINTDIHNAEQTDRVELARRAQEQQAQEKARLTAPPSVPAEEVADRILERFKRNAS